ncbi:MAG: 9-O-acetylesterase [Planctomycetes bacterium]|nr:9-O-acetylesterase [Planctomycetota bacterium]
MKTLFSFIFVFITFNYNLFAMDVAKVFSSGMVLQREMKVPIWGWGKAGDKVSVKFAGQTKNGVVQEGGKWMVHLDPLQASSENREMSIQVEKESLILKDVVVGEVWMCSGQSNMGWTVGQSAAKTKDPALQAVPDWIAEHKKTARDPLLRRFSMRQVTSYDKEITNIDVNKWQKKGIWTSADSEKNIDVFSGVGYFFGRELRRELNVPVGVLQTPWGGKKIQPFIPTTTFKNIPKLKKVYEQEWENLKNQLSKIDVEKEKSQYQNAMAKWEQGVKEAKKNKTKLPKPPKKWQDPRENANFPSTIYNAMVNPLVPYGMRGALWYQGESNQGDSSATYYEYLKALISGWRERWGQGDFPFYFSQLAGYKSAALEPKHKSSWAIINDNMRRTLEMKNTGMAVTNDVGDHKDIHPRNKVDVGKRLALWALAKDYGKTDIVYSGPLYESHSLNGNKYTITFSSVGDGLMTARKQLLDRPKAVDEPLGGFQISDTKGIWKWAEAKIVGKNKVEAYHPEIDKPSELRYAWAANPVTANLYNKSGLPASCFTTQD